MSDIPDLEELLADSLAEHPPAPNRICPACSTRFYARRGWQKFCSNACRRGWHLVEAEEAKARQAQLLDDVQAENERLHEEVKQLRRQLGQLTGNPL